MRSVGDVGEAIAEKYLISKGAKILARNYTIRGGEIDLIAELNETILFVEVKLRRSTSPAPRRSIFRKTACSTSALPGSTPFSFCRTERSIILSGRLTVSDKTESSLFYGGCFFVL